MATGFFYKTAADITASLNNTAGSLIAVMDEVLDIASEGYGGTLGWEKPFPDALNVAVYRATTGNRAYLQVNDAYTETARVRMFATMTDLLTGTGPCPNGSPQATSWCRVMKADEAGDHHFHVVGDSRYFAFFTRHDNIGSYKTYAPFCFGDFNSYDTLDTYNTVLVACGASADNASYQQYKRSFMDNHTTSNMEDSASYIGSVDNTGMFFLANPTGLSPSSPGLIHDPFYTGVVGSYRGSRGMCNFNASPALVYAPMYLFDTGNAANQTMANGQASHGADSFFRGTLPYVYSTPFAGLTGGATPVNDGASEFLYLEYTQTYESGATLLTTRVLFVRTSDDEPGRTF